MTTPATSDFLRNGAGDLDVTAGNFAKVTGRAAIAQLVTTRLRAWAGEHSRNLFYGLPYRSEILVKAPDLTRVGAFVKAELVDVPGVLGIKSFTSALNRQTRAYSFTAELYTVDGTLGLTAETAVGMGTMSLLFWPASGGFF